MSIDLSRCLRPIVLLILSVLLTTAHAVELDELRLFHDPSTVLPNEINKSETPEKIGAPEQARETRERSETWVQYPMQAPDDNPNLNTTYQYHGFISGPSGIQYLINGVPLVELNTLELLSVNKGGRMLELKTDKGRVFQLLIGQSIQREPL